MPLRSSAHEGEGAYDPHLGSEDFGGGGYESGQSSQVQGGDNDLYDNADADGDDVHGHLQNEMENEDTDGYSAEGDDSDESDGKRMQMMYQFLQDGIRTTLRR